MVDNPTESTLGKYSKKISRAVSDLWSKWNKRRRRKGVSKFWIVVSNCILFLLFISFFLWLYFHYSPNPVTMHWAFVLMGLIASSVGVIFSLIAAWRSSAADKRTAWLLKELVETQRIVGESPAHYPEVFDLHLLRPMERASEPDDKNDHLRHMDLLISTPAYGYHVLGIDPHLHFRNLLTALQCDKQVILFSPDAHYFHIANTLLWHPLKQSASRNVEADDVMDAPAPDVNPIELADCVTKTMSILKQQVLQTEENARHKGLGEHRNIKVGVWTTNTTEVRLTAFRFQKETLAYLLLTDQVTLTSDLSRFRGRALSLPVSIHRQVIGDPGDPRSFFEQLKTCPYSQAWGNSARIKSGEFDLLKYDYLFLRTEQTLFDLYSFNIQCRQVIEAVREPKTESDRIRAARDILLDTVQYFINLKEMPVAPQYAPLDELQQKKLLRLNEIAELLKDKTLLDATQVLEVLRDNPSNQQDPFWHKLEEYEDQLQGSNPDFINLAKWVACIYYFISSGFNQSLYAKDRRNRARHMQALSAEDAPQLTPGSDLPISAGDQLGLTGQRASDLSPTPVPSTAQSTDAPRPETWPLEPDGRPPDASPQARNEATTTDVQPSNEQGSGEGSHEES
jgi:hypothetical protein